MDFPGLTVLEQWSTMMHEIFISLVDSGFTRSEAITIVSDIATSAFDAARGHEDDE